MEEFLSFFVFLGETRVWKIKEHYFQEKQYLPLAILPGICLAFIYDLSFRSVSYFWVPNEYQALCQAMC